MAPARPGSTANLGILGGLGPESTLDYYRLLIDRYRERAGDGNYPAFVLNSLNLKPAVDAVTAGDLATLTRILVDGIDVLARAGANVGLIAANTPHIVFDEVQRASAFPLISIVETACEAAKAAAVKRLALFGTRFTMSARFYPDVFEREGLAIVPPPPVDQDWIHERYFGELLLGILRDETRAGLLAIVERMRERDGIDALLIGGTELSPILSMESHAGVRLLDTGKIHVERAVDVLLGERSVA